MTSPEAEREGALQRLVAEGLGTFALVFAGTGAIVVNELFGGAVTHIGVAMTFGLVITAMIYAIGDVSGAHFNPAVTFGFWLARRFPGRDVLPYVSSQLAGAVGRAIVDHQHIGISRVLMDRLDEGAKIVALVVSAYGD